MPEALAFHIRVAGFRVELTEAIAAAVESERRKKQAETQSETMKKPITQLVAPQVPNKKDGTMKAQPVDAQLVQLLDEEEKAPAKPPKYSTPTEHISARPQS